MLRPRSTHTHAFDSAVASARSVVSWPEFIAAFMAVSAWTSTAWALPSPDTLLNLSQLVPVAVASIGGAVTFLVARAWRFVRARKDPTRFLFRLSGALAVVSLGSLAVHFYQYARQGYRERIENTASYFRCDMAAHESRMFPEEHLEFWRNAKNTTLTELDARVRRDSSYDPVLLIQSGNRFRYDSGILAVGPEDRLHVFQFVTFGEAAAFLEAIPREERGRRDLVLLDNYFLNHGRLMDLVMSFRQVQLIKIGRGDGKFARVREADGTLRPAKVSGALARLSWPVRDYFLIDQEHVEFANMKTLLGPNELTDVIADPSVAVVLAYNGRLRSRWVQIEYAVEHLASRLPEDAKFNPDRSSLAAAARANVEVEYDADEEKRWLGVLEANRVYLNDFASATRTQDIEALGRKLAGHRFLVGAFVKHDWEWYGLDLAYQLHRRAQARGESFGYLGGTLQLSEFAAAVALGHADAALRSRLSAAAATQFDHMLAGLAKSTAGSLGLALIVMAFALRLLFLPLQLGETRARLFRRLLSQRPELRARFAFLRRKLKARTSSELLGGLVTLLLVLPTFQLLTRAQSPVNGARFLWESDLGRPSLVWALLTALITVAVPGWLALRARPKRSHAMAALLALAFVAAVILLQALVPVAVCVYVCAVALWNAGVRWYGERALQRDLQRFTALSDPGPVSTAPGPGAFRAFAQVRESDCGLKASQLARLARCTTPLFSVPRGFVVQVDRAAASLPALDAYVRELPGGAQRAWAVRSCAAGEDGSAQSMAGQCESVLDVRCGDLQAALQTVIASYRGTAGESASAHAAIVQEMVQPDFAGVVFSRSPDNAELAMIEFTEGLAAELLTGARDPRTARVGRLTGTVDIDDPSHAELVQHVFAMAMAVEQFFGQPQDIEWAYVKRTRTLHVLQSRSITATTQLPDVAREQARVIALASERPAAFDGARLWKVSEVQTVAASPSPFTNSLLAELYAADSSLGLALERLGLLRRSAMAPDVMFGRLYDRKRPLSWAQAHYQLRRTMLARRLRDKRLTARWVSEIDARGEAFERPQLAASAIPTVLAGDLIAQLRRLGSEVYVPVFEANLLLACCPRPARNAPPVETVLSALYRDLARVASGDDVAAFVARWGHRSVDDYELSVPSFAERPQDVLAFARDFASDARRYAVPDANAEPYAQLVALKERCKDRALKWLRQLRPSLLRLAHLLELEDERAVFALTLADLRALADGRLAPADARALASSRATAQRAFSLVELPGTVRLCDLEFLGMAPGTDDALPQHSAQMRGRMLSIRQPFAGRICTQREQLSEDGTGSAQVLVVPELRPELVGVLDRCAAIITEVGGELSHAAIVARERQTPVLQLEGARRVLERGAEVQVSMQGVVTIMARRAHEPAVGVLAHEPAAGLHAHEPA